MGNRKIEKGNVYGRLTVIDDIFDNEGKYFRHWVICRCSCEKKTIKIFLIVELKSGETKSCGCLKEEYNNNRKEKRKNKPFDKEKYLYKMWAAMKSRCNNKNSSGYHNYGGRGIKHDENWINYESFREDMLGLYIKFIENNEFETPSLERIDVNGNYCKENCLFIPYSKQAENTRPTNRKFVAISPEGNLKVENWVSRFARDNNLKQHSISSVLNNRRVTAKGWRFSYIDLIQEMDNSEKITIKRKICSKDNPAKGSSIEWYHPESTIVTDEIDFKIYFCPHCKLLFKESKIIP